MMHEIGTRNIAPTIGGGKNAPTGGGSARGGNAQTIAATIGSR